MANDIHTHRERNIKMYRDWVCRQTQKKLAAEHNISPARVAQIVWKMERRYGLAYHKNICLGGEASDDDIVEALKRWKKKDIVVK